MPTVAVVGGSLGGLTAGLVLRDAGCDVTVYERSLADLEARGAGIAMLAQTLRYPVQRQGVPAERFCSTTGWIRFLERDGTVSFEQPHRYWFSSWNAVYRTLLGGFDRARYRLGCEMVSFKDVAGGVTVCFADGSEIGADLLVCADGVNSTARAIVSPDVAPRYSGYVAWRGVVPEGELSARTRAALHDALTYQLLPNSHILVYPIPGHDGTVTEGRRLMNMVWYRNLAEDDLPDLLTDRHGRRRSVSLPPGAARHEVVADMRAVAAAELAPAIAEVVGAIPEPFVQAVVDIEVPHMVWGRTCLIGDAAFAVRPHAAAGTAKAAEDAWVLAQALVEAGGDVDIALRRWEDRQLSLGRALLARTRDIGDSSQFTGTFRPGDPRLIFGLYCPGR